MGVLDRLLSILKLNDDYDDDDFMDDDDLEEEPKPRKFFTKREKPVKEDLDEEDESFDQEPIIRKTLDSSKRNVRSTTVKKKSPESDFRHYDSDKTSSGKISSIRTRSKVSDMSLCVIRPKSQEDMREVVETLVSGCSVVLNLEGVDYDLSQRTVDFSCGASYAIGGGFQRVSNTIFIVTPANVDITGDIKDLLNDQYNIPSFNF